MRVQDLSFRVLLIVIFNLPFIEAQAGIEYRAVPGESRDEIVLSGRVNYGDILLPFALLRKNLQEGIDKKSECASGGLGYHCAEYPLGRVMGNDKFFMLTEGADSRFNFSVGLNGVKTSNDIGETLGEAANDQSRRFAEDPFSVGRGDRHFTVHYKDVRSNRQLDIPIQLGRDFHRYNVTNFKLLDPDRPGAQERPFEISRRTLGDTLVKMTPADNVLYATVCQFMPGSSVQNSGFSGKYQYSKIGRLTVNFSGTLGGVTMDGVRVCSLSKFELRDNKIVEGMIGVQAPLAYNIQRIPFRFRISRAFWVQIMLIGVILGAFLAMGGGGWLLAIGSFVSMASIVGATLGGIYADSIITNYVNRAVDEQIKKSLGVRLEDLNSEFYAKQLRLSSAMAQTSSGQLGEGDVRNGNWSVSLLTEGLMRDHQIIAMASANYSLDSYFKRFSVEVEKARAACFSAADAYRDEALKIIDRGVRAPIPNKTADRAASTVNDVLNRERASVERVFERTKAVCQAISQTTVSYSFFKPIEQSQASGCYDSFIRFDEIRSDVRSLRVLSDLRTKISKGSGRFASQVANEIDRRLAATPSIEIPEIKNWWSKGGSGTNACAFDNRITIRYPAIRESRFVGCVFQAISRDRDPSINDASRILSDCRAEIRGLE